MQAAGKETLPQGLGGLQFYHPRPVGVGKDCLFLFWVVTPPWSLVREYLTLKGQTRTAMVPIQVSRRVVLKLLPLIWTWMLALPHPPFNDLKHLSSLHWSSKPASFWRLSCIIINFTGVSQSSLGFPLYLMVPYWNFHKYLFHPYHYLNWIPGQQEQTKWGSYFS